MSDLTNAVSLGLEQVGKLPVAAPAGDESIPNDIADYVTPPPKKVIVVEVRYSEAKKGAPMPYDLADGHEVP
jgi:hypothetical protein